VGPQGPEGPQGPAGEPPPPPDLPRIVAINWPHAGTVPFEEADNLFRGKGFLVAFDANFPMASATLDRFTVELYYRDNTKVGNGWNAYQWIGIRLDIQPGKVDASCDKPPEKLGEVNVGDPCTGVRFRPEGETRPVPGDYLVVLRGDMILTFDPFPRPDGSKMPLALDGNHLGPGLPKRCPTGDGIEGGRFESWFSVEKG
jgi:hypothetical protein